MLQTGACPIKACSSRRLHLWQSPAFLGIWTFQHSQGAKPIPCSASSAPQAEESLPQSCTLHVTPLSQILHSNQIGNNLRTRQTILHLHQHKVGKLKKKKSLQTLRDVRNLFPKAHSFTNDTHNRKIMMPSKSVGNNFSIESGETR